VHTRLTMIIPSRGRPAAAEQAARSALDNAVLPHTIVLVAVDGCCDGISDPGDHLAYASFARPDLGVILDDEHRGMAATLNRQATYHVGSGLYLDHWPSCTCRHACHATTHVGFMGDDHRVRTKGWDAQLAEAAGWWGIAYGDDLIQGAELPTSVVMSADIVRVLGHMVPPVLGHLFVDDYWKALGQGIGALTYVPDVVVEHMHPSAGKAELDASYERTNHPDQYERDGDAWRQYQEAGHLAADVAAVCAQADRQRWMGVLTLPDAVGSR
jgi:hypothetical protein